MNKTTTKIGPHDDVLKSNPTPVSIFEFFFYHNETREVPEGLFLSIGDTRVCAYEDQMLDVLKKTDVLINSLYEHNVQEKLYEDITSNEIDCIYRYLFHNAGSPSQTSRVRNFWAAIMDWIRLYNKDKELKGMHFIEKSPPTEFLSNIDHSVIVTNEYHPREWEDAKLVIKNTNPIHPFWRAIRDYPEALATKLMFCGVFKGLLNPESFTDTKSYYDSIIEKNEEIRKQYIDPRVSDGEEPTELPEPQIFPEPQGIRDEDRTARDAREAREAPGPEDNVFQV